MKHPLIDRYLKESLRFLRGFLSELFEDRLGHYASSLSWSTLFSLVPFAVVLLTAFAMMPGFEVYYLKVEHFIAQTFLPTQSETILAYLHRFIEGAYKLGILGLLYALYAMALFFKNYDFVVNDVAEAPHRSFWQALKHYTLLVLLLPPALLLSFWLSTQGGAWLSQSHVTALHLLSSIPAFLVAWGIFFAAYTLSPNRKADKSAASIASFVASLVWHLAKALFITYVSANSTYTTIYGSIASILFFMLWLYISWAIFIYGLKFLIMIEEEEGKEQATQ